MQMIQIENQSHPLPEAIRAGYCNGFWDRFVGLMFRKGLSPNEGLLLVESTESRVNTAIHMFFMNFDITAVWIDSNHCVVDICYAKKWRPFYAACQPARYVLETHASQLNNFQPGDILSFKNA